MKKIKKGMSAMPRKVVAGLSLSAVLLSSTAFADPLPFFDTIPGGRTYFDTRVNDANGTLYTHSLSGLSSGNSWTLPDFTITATNSANRSVSNALSNFGGALTGTPGGQAINMTANGTTGSGLTFSFNRAINGFGLDLDDWATCCMPSGLYISFDGGAPILVGEALTGTDNPGTAAGHGAKTFIGAIDDSGTFTTITFYGTGNGDVLNAGGIIRYALVPLGSISNPGNSGYVTGTVNTPVQGLASYFKANEGSGPRQIVSNYLDTLDTPRVVEALKTIYPVNTSVTSQTMLSSSGQTSNVLIEKVGTVLGSNMGSPMMGFADGSFNTSTWLFGEGNGGGAVQGGEMDAMYSLAASPYKKFNMGEQAVWFQGVGATADGDATQETMGYDTVSRGFVGGYEMALDQNHLVGVLASNFWSDVKMDNNAGKTEAKNYNLGLYGQKLIDETKLTAVVSGGYGDYESERRINLGGIAANPQSDYNGWSASASLSASHLFTHNTIQIEPFAQLSYTHVWTEGYDETGGGAFNMSVSSDKFSTAGAKIGVNVQNDFDVKGRKLTVGVKPYIGNQWELEEASNKTNLVGSNSATTINGRDLTTFEVGAAVQIAYDVSDNTTLKFGSDFSRDKYEERYVGFVGVGFKF